MTAGQWRTWAAVVKNWLPSDTDRQRLGDLIAVWHMHQEANR